MQTYLFDFDGTLVDSMPTFIASALRVLDENGVAYEPNIINTITPLGFKGTAEYYQMLGLKLSVEDTVAKMKAYAQKAYEESILAKPSVIEVLHALKARGASLNVLTASPHETLDCCLQRLGIFDIFGRATIFLRRRQILKFIRRLHAVLACRCKI